MDVGYASAKPLSLTNAAFNKKGRQIMYSCQPLSRRVAMQISAAAATTALALVGVGPAAAQSTKTRAAPEPQWPTKPLKILVGFPAGSTPDMAARTLAEPLSRALGQPVIVENKPGAAGNIAADQVAKSADDHTLGVVINGNLTSAKLLYSKLPYDPPKDFSFLSLLTTAPLVLVTTPSQPDGLAFFDAARKGGAQWNFGSPGNGTVGHLGMELLKSRAGDLGAVHVPYPGNPQVVTALLGGQLQMALIPPGLAMPQVRAGRLKAIGVTSTGRNPLVPELPPLADAGINNFQLEVFTALVGPAGLSKAAQAKLASVVPGLVREADTRQKLFNQGWQAVGTSPEGLATRVKAETMILGGIIAQRGIKID